MTYLKKTEWQFSQRQAESVSIEDCSACYSTVHASINFLSSITNKVLEQAAWKYLNPNKSSTGTPKSDNQAEILTIVYEQVIFHCPGLLIVFRLCNLIILEMKKQRLLNTFP
jgi:hypothetical protein